MNTSLQGWRARSEQRLPDQLWHATLHRVRGEFAEMPCLRVTREQARILLGLEPATTEWILSSLAREGFLDETATGEFIRRKPSL
jgi:hypothetical protein